MLFDQNRFPPGPNEESGEQVFQMLWDCRFCGTQKLLGVDHRHCPNCGAAQDPAWRYFPSEEDKKAVTATNYKYAGIDKVCPFCQTPNSAASNFCINCGGDLKDAQPVALKESVMQGSIQDTGKAEDLVLKKFQQEQGAIKAKKGGGIPRWLIVILLLVVAGIVGFIILSRSTYQTTLKVTDTRWERTIQVQQLNRQSGGNWCDNIPGDAYNVSRSIRTDYRQERYQCGSETQRVDRGDGTFREIQVPKYCTRDVPFDRAYCSYSVNRWQTINTLRLSGAAADPIQWPNFTQHGTGRSVGDQRGVTSETLEIIFTGEGPKAGQTFTYTAHDEAEWRRFKVGQFYNIDFNRLEQAQWDTMTLTER